MANAHWSQFSHNPKIFIFNPLALISTFAMLFAAQKWGFLIWVVFFMWVYILTFQFYFKMPISYTGNLLRKLLTGKNKKPKNWRDDLEL